MSFQDEIRKVIKTPDQAARENQERRHKMGFMYAERDYKEIKEMLIEEAKNGRIHSVNGKRALKCEYESPTLESLIEEEYKIFDGLIHYGIVCNVTDDYVFQAYKEELEKMVSQDDIQIEIKAIFKDDDGRGTKFKIPGTDSSLDKRTTAHITRNTRFKKVICCCIILDE